MQIDALFDEGTNTLTYVVWDPATRDAVVIDPVQDFDLQQVTCSDDSTDRVVQLVNRNQLKVHWILETHAHADHLSGAPKLKQLLQCQVAIGSGITKVQEVFKRVLGLPESFPTDGSQFDRLLEDEEVLEAGTLSIRVLHTPGHTPACCSYVIGDAVFVGDAMFMPDFGTGRCDFPAGDAETLYTSITTRILSLPADTRVFTCHDYMPGGRELRYQSTVAEQRNNKHLAAHPTRSEYVSFRTTRDAGLRLPRLLFPSIQCNIAAGELPPAEGNGIRYLRLPLDAFVGTKLIV